MSNFTLKHRFIVDVSTVAMVRGFCEPTEDYYWIGAKGNQKGAQKLRRFRFRGVPARLVDCLLPEWEEDTPMAVEIGDKVGRYSDDKGEQQKRTQIVVRYWRARDSQPLPYGRLGIAIDSDPMTMRPEVDPDQASLGQFITFSAVWFPRTIIRPATVDCSIHGKPERKVEISGGSWIETHKMLISKLNGDPAKAIILWHWKRYFTIPFPAKHNQAPDEVQSVINEFASVLDTDPDSVPTIAEANCLADRLLYRAAVDAGWRKLTAKEKLKWGFFTQWVRREHLEKRRRETEGSNGNASGVGDFSQRAARGDRDYVRDSYRAVDVEG
jgi:hypothetical protein